MGQIYLTANPLLRERLQAEQVKPRLLGHFGTVPGLNLVFSHANLRAVPSHCVPETPGSFHEGGEAETGSLATSWHGNKFLNPVRGGAVLPILALNEFTIANPTILARISEIQATA